MGMFDFTPSPNDISALRGLATRGQQDPNLAEARLRDARLKQFGRNIPSLGDIAKTGLEAVPGLPYAADAVDLGKLGLAKLGEFNKALTAPPPGVTPPTPAAPSTAPVPGKVAATSTTDTTTNQTLGADVEDLAPLRVSRVPFAPSPLQVPNRGVLGEGSSTHPEVRPGTPEAMQSLWWNEFLDKREGEKRADEMANLALEQERTKTAMLPKSLEADISLKGAQGGLAGAQGGLLGAQQKQLERSPEEKAYADSQMLPLRKWVADHYDDPGVGDAIEARALQMAKAFQQQNPKISPARLKLMESEFLRKAFDDFITENNLGLQSKAVGVMGSPLGTNLFNNPYGY